MEWVGKKRPLYAVGGTLAVLGFFLFCMGYPTWLDVVLAWVGVSLLVAGILIVAYALIY
jgi:hypothetical protein